MKTKTTKTATCYLQVNTGSWAQESYETASRDAGRRTKQLRRAGYQVTANGMGPQVTPVGTVNMTLVSIRPGIKEDTFHLPTDNWKLADRI